jgi:CRP-like cAMP-binding protein/SAM-dependent methyltransferase
MSQAAADAVAPSNSIDNILIEAVARYAKPIVCPKGEHLVATGEMADCFYYVEEGAFEISYLARQTPIVVALIGAGNFIGEIGFFDHLTRTRKVMATEDAYVHMFNRAAISLMSEQDPRLYARFLEFLLGSVCARFRQILGDRGPLTAYAALLSTGREQFKGIEQLPTDLLNSPHWQKISRHLEEFKARIFDAAYRLQEESQEDVSADLHAEIVGILDAFNSQVSYFGKLMDETESADLIWGFVFKEAFPYLMRSRFFERAYYKPKGYAGDFNMIELIYRNQADGDGKLGRIIDDWCLKQTPARAVRARRLLLTDTLDRYCRQLLKPNQPMRIMNLACGPSRELFDLIAKCDYASQINAICIDIDADALEFANEQVNNFDHPAKVRFMNENVIKWALGRIKHDFGPQDIIYSSGLSDYLDKRLLLALINRCHAQLKPGGIVIIGNFSPANPDRVFMDHMLYWRLIYRDSDQMRQIFAESDFGGAIEVLAEPEGVNLFAVAQRRAESGATIESPPDPVVSGR